MITRRIQVGPSLKAKLMKHFNVVERTVEIALGYKSVNNDLHKRIRIMALKNGAIPTVTMPECECMHTADGRMEQMFDNGVKLTADLKTGLVTVTDRRGHIVASRTISAITELNAMQEVAQSL